MASGVKLDLAVLPQVNGKFAIVKIVNVMDKPKVHLAKDFCMRKPHVVDWAGEVKTRKKCLCYRFEKLGVSSAEATSSGHKKRGSLM